MKGALIKGITGTLPVEILASPVFSADIRKVMRGYSGICLLYRRKTLYSVGLASNLLGCFSLAQNISPRPGCKEIVHDNA